MEKYKVDNEYCQLLSEGKLSPDDVRYALGSLVSDDSDPDSIYRECMTSEGYYKLPEEICK